MCDCPKSSCTACKLARTALPRLRSFSAEILKKSMAAGFAASPKGTYTSHAAQQECPPINRAAQNGSAKLLKMLSLLHCVARGPAATPSGSLPPRCEV